MFITLCQLHAFSCFVHWYLRLRCIACSLQTLSNLKSLITMHSPNKEHDFTVLANCGKPSQEQHTERHSFVCIFILYLWSVVRLCVITF